MKYKLKVDARKFFPEKLHEEVQDMKLWQKHHCIPIELLDEVDKVYLEFGHSYKLKSGSKTSDLCGFDNTKKKGKFHFTVNVDDFKYENYKSVKISELMDAIQKVLNTYFKNLDY